MAWSIRGVPRKNSTYARSTARSTLIKAHLTGLSEAFLGIDCTVPTAKPIRQPIRVPVMAMRRVMPAPRKRETPYRFITVPMSETNWIILP